ncbi:hypothetical protein NDU88_003170 [Pleurodeles waltl]|uniref:Uncharacterized protein n=1 Tax=Pleurodeles waltl TaxID=8319 RepID=A0AAV7KXF7_PLEWA|nr:hypothetical protein NDU88_003170 [Pleurodeles waltl]
MARVGMRANDCDGAGAYIFSFSPVLFLWVSAHQKKDIWRAITKEVWTLEVYQRRSTHSRKRWEDIHRWSRKTAEAQLGVASQRGRGARRTMTPLIFWMLVVAYPELDGRLRASQQPQGGEYTPVTSMRAAIGHSLVTHVPGID